MLLRGPSAEALSTLESQLVSAISSAESAQAAQVGEDLFGLAGVLRSTPGLRRVVTDAAVDADAREGLARQLFQGKVDPLSLDLLVTAVRHRWTATRHLADVLEYLGVVAVVRSAEDPGRLADELFSFARLLADNPGLRNALGDPTRSEEDKRALLDGLLSGRILAPTSRLVQQSLAGSYRTVSAAVLDYQKTAAAVHGERVATVRSARPLTDEERQRLQGSLTAQYGREVHLNVVVDPRLIGGLRVEIGDDVIDGTIASRLDDAGRRLAG
jgi:F-type H+-transporting ATPase subunit delta